MEQKTEFNEDIKLKPFKPQKRHKQSTDLSRDNETKLSILLTVFKKYMTAGEIAKETHSKVPGLDFETHKQNIHTAVSRLRWRYTHPYLKHERLRKPREGGRMAYKASDKGRKMACELHFRKKNSIDLKWKREKVNSKGKIYIGGNYNIVCSGHCKSCSFNPFTDGNNQIAQPPNLHIQAQADTLTGAGAQTSTPGNSILCAVHHGIVPSCPNPACRFYRDCHPRRSPVYTGVGAPGGD